MCEHEVCVLRGNHLVCNKCGAKIPIPIQQVKTQMTLDGRKVCWECEGTGKYCPVKGKLPKGVECVLFL